MTIEEKREKNRLKARAYRLKNKERVNAYDRARWRNIKRYQRRAKYMGNARCLFCDILLAAKSVKIGHRKYCDTCKADPRIRLNLQNQYMRRLRQRKKGLKPTPVRFNGLKYKYKGVGRPATKSIVPV